MRRTKQLRGRAAVVAVLALAAGAAGLSPGPLGSPLRRLANAEADGPDPLWDVPGGQGTLTRRAQSNGEALRRAHGIVRRGETYFVDARGEPPLLVHDLIGGARLFLLPGLPVVRRRSADWILSTAPPRPDARGQSIRLGPTLFLARRR